MNDNETGQRITFKRARPNPLFQEWLEELYEEAKVKKSKLESRLKEALDSLSKYPLPLQSGAECVVLKGFEKRLCAHIDQRLEVYKYNKTLAESTKSQRPTCSNSRDTVTIPMTILDQNINTSEQLNDNPCETNSIKNTKDNNDFIVSSQESTPSTTDTNSLPQSQGSNRSRKYKPAYRSGAYALLVGLMELSLENPNTSVTKEDLINHAQKYAEESFIRPKPDTFYTAWSSMSKLVTKGLVRKVRNKTVNFILTAEGKDLARQLSEEYKYVPTTNDIIFNGAPTRPGCGTRVAGDVESVTTSQNLINTVVNLPANSFDIVLLIDKNETSGVSKKTDPTVAQFNKYPDLNHEYRSLKVGDFTWIARHKGNKDQELVLPYVIERKRMDDLGASIKDGRFHEQKFRLRRCGLKNVIYLVENYGSNKHVGLPIQSLKQALANTMIQDGFKVHITDSLTDSVKFLAMMTKRLSVRYKVKDLIGQSEEPKDEYLMTFDYFNKSSAKTKALTVTETFVKLLLQLKGVSVDKALAITAKYSTPSSLILAYKNCEYSYERENLLANLKYGDLGRNVGPAVSKSISMVFSTL